MKQLSLIPARHCDPAECGVCVPWDFDANRVRCHHHTPGSTAPILDGSPASRWFTTTRGAECKSDLPTAEVEA